MQIRTDAVAVSVFIDDRLDHKDHYNRQEQRDKLDTLDIGRRPRLFGPPNPPRTTTDSKELWREEGEAAASRPADPTEEVGLDRPHPQEARVQRHTPGPILEPTGKEEEATTTIFVFFFEKQC